MDKQTKIFEILEARNRQDKSLDVSVDAGYTEEEIPAPSPRFEKLINIYYADEEHQSIWKSRIGITVSGGRTRVTFTEIRRAKAYGAALAHTTPTIWPGEQLVMNKTKNWRGAFPFPWVDASFFNAQAEALLDRGGGSGRWPRRTRYVRGRRRRRQRDRELWQRRFPSRRSSVCARKRVPVLVEDVQVLGQLPRWSASVTQKYSEAVPEYDK